MPRETSIPKDRPPESATASLSSSIPVGLSDPATWVDSYGDALYRFALVRLRDAGLAEEAVQETFLAALGAAASFAGRSSERTWLFGILKRKVVDTLRHRMKERPIGEGSDSRSPDEAIDALFQSRGSWARPPGRWTPDPEALAESADFWRVFEKCFGSMPERVAQAFSLRVMDGHDAEDACKILGVSLNNLFVILHRARTRLRQCLEANWFEAPSPPKARERG
ncbi:MAG: sigma-70 family RNA polymerase sigma factor [Planctomycetota bacterium]